MTTVVIVDDDRLVCEHLEEQLGRREDLECIGVAQTAAGARELVRKTRPDLIVLDIILQRGTDPLDLAADLVRLNPQSRIVVLTAWSDDPRLGDETEFRAKVRASRGGVVAWISKGRGIDEVVARLREAARWCADPVGPSPLEQALGAYLQAVASAHTGNPFHGNASDAKLTPMEVKIAAIAAHGLEADMTIEEIAKDARLVPGTIRGHLKTIYAKWGVHTQPAFVAEARRRGLLGA